MAYILYHDSCYDGFGAAWAVSKALMAREGPPDVYLPCSHGAPMPEVPDGQQVIIVDFSFPEEALRSLARRSLTVILLDHHKTAQKDLEGFLTSPEPNMDITFDMAHSGANLAWHRFNIGDFPLLLQYIEDRDLWTNQMEYIEEITAWLRSYERTFVNFESMNEVLEHSFISALGEGTAILRFQRQKVKEICDAGTRMLNVGGYMTPIVNAPYVFASDVGAELLKRYPDAPFTGYYFDRNDSVRQWGLRSRKGFDCSRIAKQYGGGGHAQACGYQESLV